MKLAKILKTCRVDMPARFRLADCDPTESFGLDISKDDVKAMLADGIARLSALQEGLYAQDRWAVLIVLQGMDAAGKDSVIKHVMSGVNPQGCEVHSFKAPSDEELQHDFLWRCAVTAAGARTHRDFQPLVLRRSPGGAGASRQAACRRSCRPILPARHYGRNASRKFARSSAFSCATARWC